MKSIAEQTHCISCGDELSDSELQSEIGHCNRCINEACEEYWSLVRKGFE